MPFFIEKSLLDENISKIKHEIGCKQLIYLFTSKLRIAGKREDLPHLLYFHSSFILFL